MILKLHELYEQWNHRNRHTENRMAIWTRYAGRDTRMAAVMQVFVLIGLVSLARQHLPEPEVDNVETWKATLYRRLNGVRAFDRPVPLLLVSCRLIRSFLRHLCRLA